MPLELSDNDLKAIARSRVGRRNLKLWIVIYIAIILSWGVACYYSYISSCADCFLKTYYVGALVLFAAFIIMVITDYIGRRKELKVLREAYKEGVK